MKPRPPDTRRDRRLAVRFGVVLAVLVAVTLATPAWAKARGHCATAHVPWPLVLPDGSTHPPGPLKVCVQDFVNPVTGLHEIRVDSMRHGLFHSRAGMSEGKNSDHPILVFHRKPSGEHLLVGYAWPGRDRMHTYTLYALGGKPAKKAEPQLATLAPRDLLEQAGMVRLVALAR